VHDQLAIVAVIAMLPMFFMDLEPWRRILVPELHAFAHLLFFALLAWLALRAPQLQHYGFAVRGVTVLLLALLLGTAMELLQPLFGRQGTVRDVWQNVLGAATVVALSAPAGVKRRLLTALVAVILYLELHASAISLWDRGVARTQFPLLSDFSTAFEHRRWSRGEPDNTIARTGERSLRVDLRPGRFSGTTLQRSLGDWTHFRALALSIYNDADDTLMTTVSIRDHAHLRRGGGYHDRFNRHIYLSPGWNDIWIPIADIRDAPADRVMTMNEIAALAVFASDLEEERRIYIDSVRLATDPWPQPEVVPPPTLTVESRP
uniref:hypothetical protein n=1 Tax=Aquisalimonas sp. TaxID=1872621 RepID=UPI0025BFDFCB